MQIIEKCNEGLRRELEITVSAQDLASKLDDKLAEIQKKAHLKGFRPGKVPVGHLRKVYGRSLLLETIENILQDSVHSIPQSRSEQAALLPQIDVPQEQQLIKLLDGKTDLVFAMNYEVLPQFTVKDISSIKVTRLIADIKEEMVDQRIAEIKSSIRSYSKKDGKAQEGDRLIIDYIGRMGGEAFANGSAKDAHLVIGEKRFIPGFEEQLIGIGAGESKIIKVTFPQDYQSKDLAGKEAEFEITVKEVAAPGEETSIDEVLKATRMENIDQLKERIRKEIEAQYGYYTRQHLKRQIFDQLAKDYDFTLPSSLAKFEFDHIWQGLKQKLQAEGTSFAEEGQSEEQLKTEYQSIAERRVRLGLVIAEIGKKEAIEVSKEDLQQAVFKEAMQYPGREKQVFKFFQDNKEALANLRAPILEEKVIDRLLEKIAIEDKYLSPEELIAQFEADEEKENPSPSKAQPEEPAKGEAQGQEKAAAKAKDKTSATKPSKSKGERAKAKPKAEKAAPKAEKSPASA